MTILPLAKDTKLYSNIKIGPTLVVEQVKVPLGIHKITVIIYLMGRNNMSHKLVNRSTRLLCMGSFLYMGQFYSCARLLIYITVRETT